MDGRAPFLPAGKPACSRMRKWILAEGADACKMQRSIPLEKAMEDILVAYGQNGEALRPEQGYPLRLVIPGWEGNTNVKWLRRLKVTDQPYSLTRDETSRNTPTRCRMAPRARFTFVMEAKSVVTSIGRSKQLAGAGFHEITGLAWSADAAASIEWRSRPDGGSTWQGCRAQRAEAAYWR